MRLGYACQGFPAAASRLNGRSRAADSALSPAAWLRLQDPRGCQTDETPALKGEIHISGGGFAEGILFVAGNTLQLFETFLLGERVQGGLCFEQFAVQESHLVSEFFVLVPLVRPEGQADVINVVGGDGISRSACMRIWRYSLRPAWP